MSKKVLPLNSPEAKKIVQEKKEQEQRIAELQFKIKELIAERPELQKLQDEIDEKLSTIPLHEHQRRNQVIQEMMCNKWYEIVGVWESAWNKKH